MGLVKCIPKYLYFSHCFSKSSKFYFSNYLLLCSEILLTVYADFVSCAFPKFTYRT